MAADLTGAGAPDPWSWGNMIGAAGGILSIIGAPMLLQKMIDHFSGRRKSAAEAEKAEVETEIIRGTHAAEFEKAVNDRVKAVLDSWEKQVALLTTRIQAQQNEIESLRGEVVKLRKALDSTTKDLNVARIHISNHPD